MKAHAEISRDRHGTPVLGLFNLSPEHFEILTPVIQLNGDSVAHQLRSNAGAHLESWNPESRFVTLKMHGNEPWMFVHFICNEIGIPSGRIPNIITEYVG